MTKAAGAVSGLKWWWKRDLYVLGGSHSELLCFSEVLVIFPKVLVDCGVASPSFRSSEEGLSSLCCILR